MVGVKEICALLLAGSMGAGSVVAVNQVKAPQTKSRAKAAKPKFVRPASQTAMRPAAVDCPTIAAPVATGIMALAPVPEGETTRLTGLVAPADLAGVQPGGGLSLPPLLGGGSTAPAVPGAPPAVGAEVAGVPQPAAWAMMVSGFGLVGLALRRRENVDAVVGSESV
jgi:hypothetical protein